MNTERRSRNQGGARPSRSQRVKGRGARPKLPTPRALRTRRKHRGNRVILLSARNANAREHGELGKGIGAREWEVRDWQGPAVRPCNGRIVAAREDFGARAVPARSATVRIAVLEGDGGGDEVERVIAGFGGDGVFAGLGHVTFNAAAASAGGGVMRVFGEGFFLEMLLLSGRVAGEAERVVAGGFEGHGGVAAAVGVVAVGALEMAVVHDALHEGVAQHAIFVRRAVLPKLGRDLALGCKAFPKSGEFVARLVAHGPRVFRLRAVRTASPERRTPVRRALPTATHALIWKSALRTTTAARRRADRRRDVELRAARARTGASRSRCKNCERRGGAFTPLRRADVVTDLHRPGTLHAEAA